jgi:DNA-binding NtrC family response regulator
MLGSEEDPARLPPRILEAAIELTNAERAFLVRVEGPDPQGSFRLAVLATRGFTGDALAGPEGEVSRTVVERTLKDGGRAVITSRPADAELIRVSSIVGRGILSLVSVPLRLRGALVGVLYLDSRGEKDLFEERDLPVLQTFATQAALSLELAREAKAPASRPAEYLVGESSAMQALLEEVRRVSRTNDPVLICGEPGTESGLVAREVHAQGPDASDPFRSVGCGGPPAEEAHRILGHAGEPGPLARAGTLCLEEVEALGSELQRLLARALHEGSFVIPGSGQEVPVRARLVALTGVDLSERARAGHFRSDLYYRLDVQRLVVPPLRQRREDLGALCAAVLGRLGGTPVDLTGEAVAAMQRYSWPGNLLELEGELRRLRGLGMPRVGVDRLSPQIRDGRGVAHARTDFSGRTLGELEEELVRTAMRDCGGVKARAARQLGIPRSTLYHLLERYGIA